MITELALLGFGIVSLTEVLLWTPQLWKWHRQLAAFVMGGLCITTILLLVGQLRLGIELLAVFSLYRAVNLGRLIKNRVHDEYLWHASRRTAWWLIMLQAVVLLAIAVNHYAYVSGLVWWYGLVVLQLVASFVLLAATLYNLRKTQPPKIIHSHADSALPTLSVAIPARNETSDLEVCLQSLIASTYPKLEILVLDDCSQDKHTPEIIRSFAHDGVRFIAGQPAPAHWLAKNYAYAQLAQAANGEILLFCGVDTRFKPESLRNMVEALLQKQKTMVSFLPCNLLPHPGSLTGLVIQPNRYAWELALPRRLVQRPPVLSTCWLITRTALEAAGGFAAVTHKVVPESYFARRSAAANDGYSFMQADTSIGLTTQKEASEQQATAIRTRYPQLHRRPELVALISLLQFGILIWPLIVCLSSLIAQAWWLAAISASGSLLALSTYSKIFNLTYRSPQLRGVGLLLPAALYDIGLLNYSMWQYEFREVIWKGRNVCIPVMRTALHLPSEDLGQRQ